MATTYYVAIPNREKYYYLGTKSAARHTFPHFMYHELKEGEEAIFFMEDTRCEDLYTYDMNYSKVDYDSCFIDDNLKNITVSRESFGDFAYEIYGKNIKKEDYINIVSDFLE